MFVYGLFVRWSDHDLVRSRKRERMINPKVAIPNRMVCWESNHCSTKELEIAGTHQQFVPH